MNLVSVWKFLKDVKNNNIRFDICKIRERKGGYIGLVELADFKKDSASVSQIQFGKLVNLATNNSSLISMKIFVRNQDNIGLEYEASMYEYITEEIIAKNLSPNFIGLLAYGKCVSDHGDLIGITLTEKATDCTYFGIKDECNIVSFQDFARQYYPANITIDQAINECLFQTVYALELLYRLKVNHNDLHSYNVLIAILPEPVDLYFNIGDKYYHIHAKYIPKIFDWDRAYGEAIGENEFIKREKTMINRVDNSVKSKYDLYTLVCDLNFPVKLNNYYWNNETFTAKENNYHFRITQTQYNNIVNNYEELYTFENNSKVYALGRAQLGELIGMNKIPKYITTAYIRVYNVNSDDEYEISFLNSHQCRMTYDDTHIPTSNQVLMSNEMFKEFSISQQDFENAESKYKYVMPGGLVEEPSIDISEPVRDEQKSEILDSVRAAILAPDSLNLEDYPTPGNSGRESSKQGSLPRQTRKKVKQGSSERVKSTEI